MAITDFVIGGVTPRVINIGGNTCNLVKMGDIGVWNAYPMTDLGSTTTTVVGDDVEGSISGCSYVEAVTTMGSSTTSPAHCTLYARLYITNSKPITIALSHHHVASQSAGQVNYAELTADGEIIISSAVRIPPSGMLSNSSSFFARIYISNSKSSFPGTSSPDPFRLCVDYGYRSVSGEETVVGNAYSDIHYNGGASNAPLCENPSVYYRRINHSGAGCQNVSCTIKTVKIRD